MRVLISGSGIAGPTLACFLAKAGIRTTVLEKSHSLLPYGQNIDLSGSAITVVKKMGLIDEVRRWNTPEKGTQFIDPKGRPFAPFPVRFGTTITELLANDDDSVEVKLSDGETQEYDLLVAADGQWSKVRKQCFPAESVDVVDKGMNAAYWTIPRLPRDNDWWSITTRLDQESSLLGRIHTAKAWREAIKGGRNTQQKLLRQEFADAGWEAQRLLGSMEQAPDFYFQPIQQIKMSKWSNSRVVCLGDAAFAPTPLTGMGTSLAIIGAYVLAGELSKLDAGRHPSKSLDDAYESILRPFVEKSQNIPFFVPAIAHPKTAWKRWLLQSFFSSVSKIVAFPWLARWTGNAESRNDGFLLPQYPCFDAENFR
ncbi:MAG: hypothetical protein Q9206_004725 [Seirophora lacunosa]